MYKTERQTNHKKSLLLNMKTAAAAATIKLRKEKVKNQFIMVNKGKFIALNLKISEWVFSMIWFFVSRNFSACHSSAFKSIYCLQKR